MIPGYQGTRAGVVVCGLVSSGLCTSILLLVLSSGTGVVEAAQKRVPTPATRAQPTNRVEVRRALEASYAAYDRAIRQRDGKALLAWLEATTTPDARRKVLSGPVQTRKELLRELRQALAAGNPFSAVKEVRVQKSTITRLDLNPRGDTVVVAIREVGDSRIVDTEGRYGPRGKERRLSNTVTVRDTWVKTPAGWKLQYDEILKVDERVDGRPWKSAAPKAAPAEGNKG